MMTGEALRPFGHRFEAMADVEFPKEQAGKRFTWDPWVRGELKAGQGALLTWVPPCAVKVKCVRFRFAPEATFIRSLVINGEEMIAPTNPIPWEVLAETAKPLDLGVVCPLGADFELHIERHATA